MRKISHSIIAAARTNVVGQRKTLSLKSIQLFTLLTCLIFTPSCFADLVINIEGVAGSPDIDISMAGSLQSEVGGGTVEFAFFFPGVQFQLDNGIEQIPVFGNLQVENITTNISQSVSSLLFDTLNGQLRFNMPDSFDIGSGDVFQFSGMGSLTLSNHTFSNFALGTYSGTGTTWLTQQSASLQISAVPEPSSLCIIAFSGVALLSRRRLHTFRIADDPANRA